MSQRWRRYSGMSTPLNANRTPLSKTLLQFRLKEWTRSRSLTRNGSYALLHKVICIVAGHGGPDERLTDDAAERLASNGNLPRCLGSKALGGIIGETFI